MRPSKLVEVTFNGIPAGQFAPFIWQKQGKYLLALRRINLSYRGALTASAHYRYLLSVEKHAGYTVLTFHLFGRSWLINIGKRQFYVQRIHQETE
jgi:hypothetical protein